MKNIILLIILAQLAFIENIQSQTSQSTAPKLAIRKFTHITEFGFLLGKQAPITNNNIYPVAYDSKALTSSYYYPYPYYSGNEQYSNFSFQHFSGYNIVNSLSVGITAGLDYYRANIITPISLGLRSTILPKRRISPIANLDAGYGFLWKNTNDKEAKINKDGGFMLNPSAGLRIKIGDDGSSLNINVGYKIQKSKVVSDQPDQNYFQTENRSFERMSIRLGFGF